MRQLAVVGDISHPEIYAALRRIGIPLIYQALHYLNNFGYLFGSPGINISPTDIQSIHVGKIAAGKFFRQLSGRYTKFISTVYNLIVNIGDILHILHLVVTELEIAPDDIKDDIAHGMTEVCLVIGSNTADIHFYLVALR